MGVAGSGRRRGEGSPVGRGVAAGDFQGDPGADWLVAAVSALVHAAAEQVTSGAAGHAAATRCLTASVAAVVRAPVG